MLWNVYVIDDGASVQLNSEPYDADQVAAAINLLDGAGAVTLVLVSVVETERSNDTAVEELTRRYSAANVLDAADLINKLLPKVGADYLERVLLHWEANKGSWGPGALRIRLKRSRPDLPVEDGWPPASQCEGGKA